MTDAPASPRKAVSSVSQQARSQKKPGAPKPKGAVRAKSGCYTCRIRRKKCDEQPNEDGACQTCVRLRLQCLGFGAKRPEWMRENNSVTELREKIKTFLASQGMIKGHSGSGPRSTDQDPPVLVLVDQLHTSSSSPPTPTLSATSSSEGPRPPHNGMNTSFERAPPHYATMPPPEQQPYGHNWQPAIPELGHDPSMNRGPMLPNVNEIMYHPAAPATAPPPPQPQPPSTMIQSPTSIVSASSSWPHVGASYYPAASTSMAISTGPISAPTYMPSTYYNHPHSSLAPSYNVDLASYSDDDADRVSQSPEGIPMGITGYAEEDRLINYYLTRVLPIQYLLADESIESMMVNLIRSSAEARNAACVLSALHLKLSYPTHGADIQAIFNRVQTALVNKQALYSEGDAMAGLHIVSSFLFNGGRGNWEFWLGIASQYVQNMLNDPRFYGPEDALRKCPESTRFIIKTTMWFDVLASVTTQTVPRFLETYRALFGGQGAYIGDPAASAPEISMLPVMGCENKIVLAIAEISNLAYWKECQLRRGTLSIPELVRRGADLEERLLAPSSPPPLVTPLQPGMYGPPALQHHSVLYGHPHAAHHAHQTQQHQGQGQQQQSGPTADEIQQRRRLTNDIFRASALVYLHTVLSGDYPMCPEIAAAVTETIDALGRIPMDAPSVHRSVVRSVVFGICISGCLSDDVRQRTFLLQMLKHQQDRESVGNVGAVQQLMEEVWRCRDPEREYGRYKPVDWRKVMRQINNELLLLV